MVKIDYIRVFDQDQSLDRQVVLLSQLKIDKLLREEASGKDCNQPEFQELLNYIREGDCAVIAPLDRLGRNYEDVKQTVAFMKQENVPLQILDAPFLNFNAGNELLDTATSDMFLSLLGYTAQNEQEKIKERQRQRVLLVKQVGRYKGRPTEYAPNSKSPQKRLIC